MSEEKDPRQVATTPEGPVLLADTLRVVASRHPVGANCPNTAPHAPHYWNYGGVSTWCSGVG